MSNRNHLEDLLKTRTNFEKPYISDTDYFVNGVGHRDAPGKGVCSSVLTAWSKSEYTDPIFDDGEPWKIMSGGCYLRPTEPPNIINYTKYTGKSKYAESVLRPITPSEEGYTFVYSRPKTVNTGYFKIGGNINIKTKFYLRNNYDVISIKSDELKRGVYFDIVANSFWNVIKIYYTGTQVNLNGYFGVQKYVLDGNTYEDIYNFAFNGPEEDGKKVLYILCPFEKKEKVRLVVNDDFYSFNIHGIQLLDITRSALTSMSGVNVQKFLTTGNTEEYMDLSSNLEQRIIVVDLGFTSMNTVIKNASLQLTDVSPFYVSYTYLSESEWNEQTVDIRNSTPALGAPNGHRYMIIKFGDYTKVGDAIYNIVVGNTLRSVGYSGCSIGSDGLNEFFSSSSSGFDNLYIDESSAYLTISFDEPSYVAKFRINFSDVPSGTLGGISVLYYSEDGTLRYATDETFVVDDTQTSYEFVSFYPKKLRKAVLLFSSLQDCVISTVNLYTAPVMVSLDKEKMQVSFGQFSSILKYEVIEELTKDEQSDGYFVFQFEPVAVNVEYTTVVFGLSRTKYAKVLFATGDTSDFHFNDKRFEGGDWHVFLIDVTDYSGDFSQFKGFGLSFDGFQKGDIAYLKVDETFHLVSRQEIRIKDLHNTVGNLYQYSKDKLWIDLSDYVPGPGGMGMDITTLPNYWKKQWKNKKIRVGLLVAMTYETDYRYLTPIIRRNAEPQDIPYGSFVTDFGIYFDAQKNNEHRYLPQSLIRLNKIEDVGTNFITKTWYDVYGNPSTTPAFQRFGFFKYFEYDVDYDDFDLSDEKIKICFCGYQYDNVALCGISIELL